MESRLGILRSEIIWGVFLNVKKMSFLMDKFVNFSKIKLLLHGVMLIVSVNETPRMVMKDVHLRWLWMGIVLLWLLSIINL